MSFHEVRFPTGISLKASGGPERRTDVVVLGSGYEERNSRWQDSRRTYNAGYGVRSLNDLHAVIAFFEERRGQLFGFRWRDPTDWKSCPPSATPQSSDCEIGTGDGVTASFQLVKTYGTGPTRWQRPIAKPVAGTVIVAVDGKEQVEGVQFAVDPLSGVVRFAGRHIPAIGGIVTAGFEFDVPVRFNTDKLEINVSGIQHGAIPSIPITEIRL
ncbi:MAG: DUF2460 domain-containing protein [Pseudomonadota bacterium]